MQFETCHIPGLVIVTPKVFSDSRGFFFEAYNRKPFEEAGITANFVQDNQSQSSYGVIRGLHFQRNPFAQSKLVRVLQGTILDVGVDIREGSPTFGQHFSIELSAENKKQLFLPAGFAHGFSVLSETAIVAYKCDNYYSKESEGGIRYDDPELAIDWKIDPAKAIVSGKDLELPLLSESFANFTY
ncbi:dTDP-4-dehydrorhamnose 3,5-epimerase [Cnuella takakiae]|uniref:dTDP-4-dehydrorhamnose 3,5-epimerase n=1 Tax=Cnuella takakiae TaxID=1302690 RepID=A0A1M5A4K1_9BACT|nr:dTDP-4-dehydrorhamnose 3,5-epimerase [Cnuella takakiae]OLY92097.1 dTDP-4-dehydrorhamnose 3,5-epimerase [Cnuella takakiae]SHF25223.1 dTDP-4-dehydrorhamnose 3,5-epimerase [Cnuella takakiae]